MPKVVIYKIDKDSIKPDSKLRKFSEHRQAKDWVNDKMFKEGYSFRQIARMGGVRNKAQLEVFTQIVQNADTYSLIFAPYRESIRFNLNSRRYIKKIQDSVSF